MGDDSRSRPETRSTRGDTTPAVTDDTDVCRPASYGTYGEATSACARIQLATGDRRRPYLPYRCLSCPLWHLRRQDPFNMSDPDDRRRIDLLDAGWRRINNPDVEIWTRPERESTSRTNRKTLEQAWLAQQRRAALKTSNNRKAG